MQRFEGDGPARGGWLSGTGHAAAALRAIADATSPAQAEIGRLAGLGGDEPSADVPPGLRTVGDLVRRADAAGQHATVRTPVPGDSLAPAASQAAYVSSRRRTNARRHAPGAPATADTVVVGVGSPPCGRTEVDSFTPGNPINIKVSTSPNPRAPARASPASHTDTCQASFSIKS